MSAARLLIIYLVGVLTAVLLWAQAGFDLASVGTALLVVGTFSYLFTKAEAARRQVEELTRLRTAYEQLDQQAKLIIRTDLELHRAQEELDRRLASLMALHALGRQLQVSLRPEEVYSKLDGALVANFGFSKALLGMCQDFEHLEWASCVGLDPQAAEALKEHLLRHGLVKQVLSNPAPRVLDVGSASSPAQRQLLELLGVQSAVLAGIIPSPGPAGCLLLGRTYRGTSQTQADEDLVAVLTNHLVTAIENSALYEESWTSSRQLEQKVQQRTQELADANAELLRLNKAKSDFVSAVSHELRTPMAAIKGYAALLGTGQFGPLAKPQSERLAKIEHHVDALTQLINDLLDIARIESGRVTMERKPIAVADLLASAHDLVRPQLEAKRLRYATDLDGVQQLVGDPQHLQRVFINLLSNAIKYTPEGGSIQVGLRRDGDTVLASVSDTGCGIPPEDLPKLFQEFYRSTAPVNQQVKGTGLGLALVRRIIEAHHGRIWVESQPGKGSTFLFRLPMEEAAA
ncbi:MAG: HAMP domain-containing histidine kinase [Candidatus Omnitrophica bacterium]|nr:HAMP domain-containing histidine kinase [Candidatus Omnitrophota bacterium]